MNIKQTVSSLLCLSVILVFTGCDWCGCCNQKKEATEKTAPAQEAKAVEPKTEEEKAPEAAPKMSMHPMPVEHSMQEPKMPMEPIEHPMPKMPMPLEHPMPEPKMPMEPKIFKPKMPTAKA